MAREAARPAAAVRAPKQFRDANWHSKIETAKEARKSAQALRKDKPPTFSTRRVPAS